MWSWMRRVAERLSRGVVMTRRMPARFGGSRIYVSPEGGGLRFWRPGLEQCDPTLFRLVEEFVRPGDTVWDIGANMGLLTFAAAHVAGPKGRVVAIEPDVEMARLLLMSRRR